MRLSVHKGQSDVVVCVCEEELEYAALRGEAFRRHSQGNHVILFFVVSSSVFVLRVEGEKGEETSAESESPFCHSSIFFAPKWRKKFADCA